MLYYSSMIDVLRDRVFNLHTDGILRELIILYHSMYNLWRSMRNHPFLRYTEGSLKHVAAMRNVDEYDLLIYLEVMQENTQHRVLKELC